MKHFNILNNESSYARTCAMKYILTPYIGVLQSQFIRDNDFSDNIPLYVETLEDGCQVKFSTNTIEYTFDYITWNQLAPDTYTPIFNTGTKCFFKASGLTPNSTNGIGTFTIDKQCNVGGNIMSMLFGDDFYDKTDLTGYNYAFYYLFKSCSTIINANKLILPATTLVKYCYANMFYGCTSLTSTPSLPATKLANECYKEMFRGCTSLTTAPELPATILANYCYGSMFSGCKSLTTAPELPATTLASYCYQYMFENCTSLTNAPKILPATELILGCYYEMFYGCTSLEIAPILPALTVVSDSYYGMFYKCSNLKYVKALFTTVSANTTLSLFTIVASTGTFVQNINATWGNSYIPNGWTVEYNGEFTRRISFDITASDVSGRATTTSIIYTDVWEFVTESGETIQKTYVGGGISDEFPQNTSTTETVTRTISYTHNSTITGITPITATTTITQGVWKDIEYIVLLNNNWQLSSTVENPDSNTYNGVYESFSNKGVNNSAATMYIDIVGYETFKLYIRSDAESNYDYVMVSQLDQDIVYNTSYSNTTLVKAHTRGKQNSGTTISNYTLVEFTGIDKGEHRITVIYRKDSGGYVGKDTGYVVIPKNQ